MLVSSDARHVRDTERRDAQNERDGARAALRRSSDSVAAELPPSTQMVVSSSRPSSRCCWQHLEEGRGGTSRRDESCAQHQLRRTAAEAASRRVGSVPRQTDDERSTWALLWKLLQDDHAN